MTSRTSEQLLNQVYKYVLEDAAVADNLYKNGFRYFGIQSQGNEGDEE